MDKEAFIEECNRLKTMPRNKSMSDEKVKLIWKMIKHKPNQFIKDLADEFIVDEKSFTGSAVKEFLDRWKSGTQKINFEDDIETQKKRDLFLQQNMKEDPEGYEYINQSDLNFIHNPREESFF